MKSIYYAHCKDIYNTPQEVRDLDTLHNLGFAVRNPNTPETQSGIEQFKKELPGVNEMEYFKDLIDQCGMMAFRALPDGRIPSGVGFEVVYAMQQGYPVIQLPAVFKSNIMSVEDTRAYLKYTGER